MSDTNRNTLSVLWIDDEIPMYPMLRLEIELWLGNPDSLEIAQTVEEAKVRLDGPRAFGIVILDLMLPENDVELDLRLVDLDAGVTLLEGIKQGAFRATDRENTRVLAYSARSNGNHLKYVKSLLRLAQQDDDESHNNTTGIEAYVAKPDTALVLGILRRMASEMSDSA